MKKNIIFLLTPILVVTLVIVMFAVFKTDTVNGFVIDRETKAPLSDICVTDGRNVVQTDENGAFEISLWKKAHFITVTVPAGYSTENYYIRIDKSVDSYDFKLDKSEITASTEHSFIQISDTEIGENGTGEWLDNLKKLVKENHPAFLIHTGDICYEPGLKKHIEEMNTQTMGCTVKYVIGNHDYVDGKYGEELYESLYGPVWYSFEVGNVHYVVTSFQTGSDYKSFYNKNDRWKWLENDLRNVPDDKKVVMFNHTKSPSDDYVLSFGRHELDLKQHNLIAWIFGHYHYNYVEENNGVVNICTPRPDCGGIDSSPAGARLIKVSENGSISTEMKYYDLDKNTIPQNTLWNTKLDGKLLFCDTLSDSGYIYTATACDDYPDNSSRIYCLDKKSGEVVWSYKTVNSVKNNLIIYEDYLVAQDTQGNVYCLEKSNGECLWKKEIELGNGLGTSSAICENNGIVFTGSSRVITALDIKTGNTVWSQNRDKGENSPAQFIVCDNKLIVNSHWDSLAALDISNGKELWSIEDEHIRFRSSTPLCIEENLLVADSNAIMIVDSAKGKMISKKVFNEYNFSSSAQPAYKDGIAYIPTADNGLIAYSLSDQKIIWSCKTGENILFTPPYVGLGKRTVESTPVLSDHKVIFGANDGMIYSVDAANGVILNKYSMGSAVLGKVLPDNEKIYAGCFDGYLACFEQ